MLSAKNDVVESATWLQIAQRVFNSTDVTSAHEKKPDAAASVSPNH
jgi:hypothetical protein